MITDSILFTVVTVTYNSSKWVKNAIESVLASDFRSFEYIIADDCSSDETWRIISRYSDDRIRKFRHKRNIGEYPNRNFALHKARGKYLLFVDGDDELYKDTLTKLAVYIKQFPEAGSIWGIPSKELVGNELPVFWQPVEIIKYIYLTKTFIAHIGFAETLFKRELLITLGGFSTKFISGDTHMKKLLALESPVLLVPKGFVYWRQTPGQASGRLSKNYNGYRNNVLIDKEILSLLKQRDYDLPISLIEENINIRNIKLLIKHTVVKGKFLDFFRLMHEFGFDSKNLRYVFKKGDYTFVP